MTLPATLDASERSSNTRSAARRKLRLGTSATGANRLVSDILVHDLSSEGLLLESRAALRIGESLAIDLPNAGSCTATVVWSSSKFYGCRFAKPLPAAAVSAALLKALPAGEERAGRGPPVTRSGPTLGEKLAALRLGRGLSVEQLADRLGVSRQALWYWETGQRMPRARMLARIAAEFGLSQSELLMPPMAVTDADDVLQRCKNAVATRCGVGPEKVKIVVEY